MKQTLVNFVLSSLRNPRGNIGCNFIERKSGRYYISVPREDGGVGNLDDFVNALQEYGLPEKDNPEDTLRMRRQKIVDVLIQNGFVLDKSLSTGIEEVYWIDEKNVRDV